MIQGYAALLCYMRQGYVACRDGRFTEADGKLGSHCGLSS